MTPIRHPDSNATWFERGARRWGAHGRQVAPLPVQRTTDQEGARCFVTHWRPTETELERIAAGGTVLLRVYGDQHPVVNVEAAIR